MATSIKPYRTRASELNPAWHVIDADGKTLGRLSSEIAILLQGKHKPSYVPHMNTGDYVIVVNASKIRVTGKKLEQKIYYRYSGYHGGLKERTLANLLEKFPTRALQYAVKGMLPKNSVGRRMLSRLKLYEADAHPHEAQIRAEEKKARQEQAVAEAEATTTSVGEEAAPEAIAPTTRARRRKAPEASAPEEAMAEAEATTAASADEAAAQEAKAPTTRRRRRKAETEETSDEAKPTTTKRRTARRTSK